MRDHARVRQTALNCGLELGSAAHLDGTCASPGRRSRRFGHRGSALHPAAQRDRRALGAQHRVPLSRRGQRRSTKIGLRSHVARRLRSAARAAASRGPADIEPALKRAFVAMPQVYSKSLRGWKRSSRGVRDRATTPVRLQHGELRSHGITRASRSSSRVARSTITKPRCCGRLRSDRASPRHRRRVQHPVRARSAFKRVREVNARLSRAPRSRQGDRVSAGANRRAHRPRSALPDIPNGITRERRRSSSRRWTHHLQIPRWTCEVRRLREGSRQ